MVQPRGPRDADVTALSCLDQCRDLYNAYVALTTGRRVVRVTYDNYTMEYRATVQGDLDRLRDLYMQTRAVCPDAMAQLPDIATGNRVRRGPAVRGHL